MQAYVWWFVLALAIAAAELLSGTFYLLVIAVALAAAGAVALAGGSFAIQLLVASAIGIGGSLWLRRRRAGAREVIDAVQNPDIGQLVRIEGWAAGGRARTQYRGAVWEVELAPGETPSAGEFEIRAIHSNRLVVARRPTA